MKRYVLLAGAALMLAPAAFAGPQKGQKAGTPSKIKCAVMTDHMVSIKEATAKKMYADYKGNRYFFCCEGCVPAFKKNPGKYAKNSHIKTPKARS